MHRVQIFSLAAAAAALLAGGASAATSVHLGPASPPMYFGSCPGTIKFTGVIDSDRAGPHKFQWYRSDGAKGPVQTLWFRPHSGPVTITDTWTLGGPGLPSFSGWEAVHMIFPAAPDSNRAKFTLRCAPRAAPPPRRP